MSLDVWQLLLVVALSAVGSFALQMTVPATGEECIYQQVEENNKLKGSFEVLAGGFLDIDATVRGRTQFVPFSDSRQHCDDPMPLPSSTCCICCWRR